MARKRSKVVAARSSANNGSGAAAHNVSAAAAVRPLCADPTGKTQRNSWSDAFSVMACETARLAGKPLTFLTAVLLVIVWAATGPLFGYSDTWQLVINTSTTIVTFLMVFLIQHTQNRDTLALQLKLAELIIAAQGAENRLATAEDLNEEDLERLHESYRRRADEALDHLTRRRTSKLKAAS
jgi:low affinity Fe/Cu permease